MNPENSDKEETKEKDLKVMVTMTEEHLKNGNKSSIFNHPLALAVNDKLKELKMNKHYVTYDHGELTLRKKRGKNEFIEEILILPDMIVKLVDQETIPKISFNLLSCESEVLGKFPKQKKVK